MFLLSVHLPDPLTLFYLVGGIASILGLILFLIVRRPERAKRLAYDVGYSTPLASVLPQTGTHRVSLTFEREGRPALAVKGVYVQFVRLANFGKEPIRQDDLTSGDPLRIDVRRARVLDIAVAGVTREVIGFNVDQADESGPNVISALVSFAFLDEGDGALVRVTTDSERARVSVNGTIVGMPQGVETIDKLSHNRPLQILGPTLVVAVYGVTLILAGYVFHAVTNSWQSLFLFPVPILALLLPLIPIILVGSTIWPSGPHWHSRLELPEWAQIPREFFVGARFGPPPFQPAPRSVTKSRQRVKVVDRHTDPAWKAALESLPPSSRVVFREAHFQRHGSEVVIAFPYEFHRRRALEFRTELEQVLRKTLGEDTTLEFHLTENKQRTDSKKP
jgi:hypothetical protein